MKNFTSFFLTTQERREFDFRRLHDNGVFVLFISAWAWESGMLWKYVKVIWGKIISYDCLGVGMCDACIN